MAVVPGTSGLLWCCCVVFPGINVLSLASYWLTHPENMGGLHFMEMTHKVFIRICKQVFVDVYHIYTDILKIFKEQVIH